MHVRRRIDGDCGRLDDAITFLANLYLMASVDLNTVREILGHTTMKMTQRYAHLSQSYKKKAMSVLDNINRHQVPSEKDFNNKGNKAAVTILSRSGKDDLEEISSMFEKS